MLKKLIIGVCSVMILLTAIAGTASAQTQPPNPPDDPQGFPMQRWGGRRAWDRPSLDVLTGVLGMTPEEIRNALQDGQTVLDLAEARGMTEDELSAALQEAAGVRIAQALADGKITQEQADVMQERIADGMFPNRGGMFAGFHPAENIAEFLGMSLEDVKAALDGGQTVAELLESRGKTMDDLKGYGQSQAQDRMQQALTDGRITQEQADRMMERIASGHPQSGPGARGFMGQSTDGVFGGLRQRIGGWLQGLRK
jgi:uncharacterized protein (DUF433 family)